MILYNEQGQIIDYKSLYLSESNENVISNPNFKKWFGNSKVVDKSGKPLIVYHGSNSDFTIFDKSKMGHNTDPGMWGKGFYFSDYETAKRYGSLIKEVYLSLQNPYIIEKDTTTIEEVANYLNIDPSTLQNSGGFVRPYVSFIPLFTSEIKDKGHDGIIVNRKGISNEYIVFNSNQIKSAIGNNGKFNKSSPDIRERHNQYII